jgi:retron-type reverse transcriptase
MDFYTLCSGFYEGNIYMQSINSSYIVLIPKKDNPSKIGDYIPISLLNSSVKLLTKLLANRLVRIIFTIIHKNQYGFIKHKNIQDCLIWAFEYLYLCKKSKKEVVIIKMDFEKAFDRIEHKAILEVLQHKGFGARWQHWMKMIAFWNIIYSIEWSS